MDGDEGHLDAFEGESPPTTDSDEKPDLQRAIDRAAHAAGEAGTGKKLRRQGRGRSPRAQPVDQDDARDHHAARVTRLPRQALVRRRDAEDFVHQSGPRRTTMAGTRRAPATTESARDEEAGRRQDPARGLRELRRAEGKAEAPSAQGTHSPGRARAVRAGMAHRRDRGPAAPAQPVDQGVQGEGRLSGPNA